MNRKVTVCLVLGASLLMSACLMIVAYVPHERTRAAVLAPIPDYSQHEIPTVKNLFSMQLSFTENRGQWDDRIRFRASTGAVTYWFRTDGVFYQFTRRNAKEDASSRIRPRFDVDCLDHESDGMETMMIKATFLGANVNPCVSGKKMLAYRCNFFLGDDPTRWRTDVANYEAILVEDVYPGIDLRYYISGEGLEYDCIVEPGANPSQIRLHYDDAKSLSTDEAGNLVVETEWGSVTESRPSVFQVRGDASVTVMGEYSVESDSTFAFRITGEFDRTLALVIDPVLAYSPTWVEPPEETT